MQQILEISDFDFAAAEYWAPSLPQHEMAGTSRAWIQTNQLFIGRMMQLNFIHLILWFINKRTGRHCVQRSTNVHVSSSDIQNSQVDPFQRNPSRSHPKQRITNGSLGMFKFNWIKVNVAVYASASGLL